MGFKQDTSLRMFTMEAQLRKMGVDIQNLRKISFDLPHNYPEIGTKFMPVLRSLDVIQNCNRYEWEGLPIYLPAWLIELMLYYKGAVIGFFEGGILKILPFAQTGGLNIYGIPNGAKPVTFNGEKPSEEGDFIDNKVLNIGNYGTTPTNAQACILYDVPPTFSTNTASIPRFELNQGLIRYQADLLGRIKNSIANSDLKVVFYADDADQVEQIKKDLRNAYGSCDPFVVIVRPNSPTDIKNMQPTILQGDVDAKIQAMFETWQSINSIRCMCSGIANSGAFEKKERKITGELNGTETQTDLVLDAGLKMRRLFIEQMKEIYPEYKSILDKIKVKINEKSINYDIVDTNNNYDYEEGGENE